MAKKISVKALLEDLSWIAKDGGGNHEWTKSVARDARLTINRLRKELRDLKR